MNNESNIQYICCYTLIDITSTGVTKKKSFDQKQRKQQSNYETFTQLISLRTQPLGLTGSVKLENQRISNYAFGIKTNKKQTVWKLTFTTEFPKVFDSDDVEFAAIIDDFHQVPIITGLDETYELNESKIITKSLISNTYFVYEKR